MPTLRRITVAVSVALTALVLTGSAALAQISGTNTEIPEAAPQNWGWQFVGVPIFILTVVFGFLFWGIYLLIVGRLRYPRKRAS